MTPTSTTTPAKVLYTAKAHSAGGRDGAGHFTWEDRADEYATLVTRWRNGGYRAAGAPGAG